MRDCYLPHILHNFTIVITGATPVFADVDLSSQNITPNSINSVISNKTKAIVCVHLAVAWRWTKFYIANKYNLYVIEDCAKPWCKVEASQLGQQGHAGAFVKKRLFHW